MKKTSRKPNRSLLRQRGNGLLAALIVLSIVVVATAIGAPAGIAAMRRSNAARTRSEEKWEARGRSEVGLSYFNERLRTRYAEDIREGRARLQGKVLPAFDHDGIMPSQSHPVIVALPDGASSYSGCEAAPQGCTSIVGNIDNYINVRRTLLGNEFFTASGYPQGTVGVADIRAVEKRVMTTSGETAYRVEYLLDARGGRNGRARDRGEVIFGANDNECGTTVRAPVAEQTIVQGQTGNIQVNYIRAKSIRIAANGAEVARNFVDDDLNQQTTTFNVTPTADTTYTIDAEGTGACRATTTHTIRVVAPVCPVVTMWDVSPLNLYGGGNVQVIWNVRDAAVVRINGQPVSASGKMTVYVNADTTFTLYAAGINGSCPQNMSRTVRVSPCPSLAFFEADRLNITRGQQAALRWQVDNLADGGRVLLNGVDVAASGTLTVTPAATTDYVLRVEPGGTCPPVEKTIRITVTDRPCPQLVRFDASLYTITEGDLLTVFWQVTNADPATTSIRLSGGGLNELVAASGSRTLSTLKQGVYTFALDITSTLPECATAIHREFTVTVNAPPPPPPTPCDLGMDSLSISASCVVPGSPVTLTWRAHSNKTDARVQINGAGSYPLSGTATVTVNSAQTFTVSVDSPTCPASSRTASVDVSQPAPVISSFAPSNSSPLVDEPFNLNWAISGAQEATINGAPVDPRGGSMSVTVNQPTDFVLVTRSGGCSPQTTQRTIRVVPRSCPVPVIQYFRPNPPLVPAGGRTSFEWSISNAEPGASVSITGPGVNLSGLPTSGSVAVNVPNSVGTFYYTITTANACASGRTVSQQTSVQVICSAPQVNAFSVNPSSYVVGSRSTINLSWNVSDPNGSPVSVSISGGVGSGLPAVGNVDITAPANVGTYTYYIEARNQCGAVMGGQVTVTVTPNVRRTGRPLGKQGGSSCNTINAQRASYGSPPLPCTQYFGEITGLMTDQGGGVFTIDYTKTTNLDGLPQNRAAVYRPFLVILGERSMYGFYSMYDIPYESARDVLAIKDLALPFNDRGDISASGFESSKNGRFTFTLPPGARKIMLMDQGSIHKVYEEAYSDGGINYAAGEYSYFWEGQAGYDPYFGGSGTPSEYIVWDLP